MKNNNNIEQQQKNKPKIDPDERNCQLPVNFAFSVAFPFSDAFPFDALFHTEK